MADPWPAEVPASLWTFNQLSAEEVVQVPMMGVKFASGFLYAFAFGCIFIAVFAWQRFRIKTVVKSPSRALTQLGPNDLGGQAALIRAYFIYAGSILLLYVSLTFFGKLLVQMARLVPAIGIDAYADKLRFDSPQWPLMLAFGFAGLAQMLPPVAAIEGWLRLRAYRAVGIPVRLEQTMRNLIVTLERAGPKGDLEESPLGKALSCYRAQWDGIIKGHPWAGAWARRRASRAQDLVSLLSQLELLVSWSKSKRGSWPGHEVSQTVRDLEETYVRESGDLLNEFQQRMSEPPEIDDRRLSGTREARLDDYLNTTFSKAEGLRHDLVGILAIFLERDIDSPDRTDDFKDHSYTDPALHALLIKTARADSAGTGPESGLFAALIAVFVLCAAAAGRGLQDPVGQYVERTNLYGMLISALVETLRLASLTWLPLLAAFSLRQYLWDNGDWARARYSTKPDHYAGQILVCTSLGVATGVLGLVLVAALKAFFIATNREYFAELLAGGPAPFLLYYPTQAIILPALIPLAIYSADLSKTPHRRLIWGVVAALVIGTLWLAHATYWNGTVLIRDCVSATAILTEACVRRMDLISHLALMTLTFLAVGIFGDLPERRRANVRERERTGTGVESAAGLALLAMLFPMLVLAPTPARAEPKPVRIGFRVDIAPFSYRNEASGPRQFHGYLADMCFDIFDGYPAYKVEAVPVGAKDRFDMFNADDVDLLCDAVTMRFSERDRSENGIYSPIVFVSGVSYLETGNRNVGAVALGFVLNATARDVALKTCHVDQFRVFMPDTRALLVERCNLRWQAALLAQRLLNEPSIVQSPASQIAVTQVDPRRRASLDAVMESWRRLHEDWDTLHQRAQYLNTMVQDQNITRLSTATTALIETVLSDGNGIQTCVNSLGSDANACERASKALSDPRCGGIADKNASAKAPADANIPFEQRIWDDYSFCPMSDHGALIKWFCTSGKDLRRVYLGDRELIVAKRDAWARNIGSCPVQRAEGAEFLSYEPYAFLVQREKPALAAFVQQRVYELFSDRAQMIARFNASFSRKDASGTGQPDVRMSVPLAYLFLLNAVENDTLFLPNADLSPEAAAGNRP